MVAPNLVWQYHHHWATMEFIRNATATRQFSILKFLLRHAALVGATSLPLAGAGLYWLLIAKSAARFRFLGWTYIFFVVMMLACKGKDYYLTPILPFVFAAGGVAFDHFASTRRRRMAVWAYGGALVIFNMIAIPLLPLLTPQAWLDYAVAMHLRTRSTELKDPFPGFLALHFGWQELTDQVSDIYRGLPASEKSEAGIFCENYNMASAINFLGQHHSLPFAISGNNNYLPLGAVR